MVFFCGTAEPSAIWKTSSLIISYIFLEMLLTDLAIFGELVNVSCAMPLMSQLLNIFSYITIKSCTFSFNKIQ